MEIMIQEYSSFLLFLGALSTFFAVGCIISEFIDRKLGIGELDES